MCEALGLRSTIGSQCDANKIKNKCRRNRSVLFWIEPDKELHRVCFMSRAGTWWHGLIAKGPYDALGHVGSLNTLRQTVYHQIQHGFQEITSASTISIWTHHINSCKNMLTYIIKTHQCSMTTFRPSWLSSPFFFFFSSRGFSWVSCTLRFVPRRPIMINTRQSTLIYPFSTVYM